MHGDDPGVGPYEASISATCPYCGEPVELALDLGGGARQDYVEDCAVCCRPWAVRVDFDASGRPHIGLTALDLE